MTVTDSYHQIFDSKNRILAVFAHPDDLELYAGGTIARLISDGKTVRSVKVSSGENGSRQEKVTSSQLRQIRETEDSRAMQTLGIQPDNNIYLHLPDGQIENTLPVIGEISRQIRLFKPDLIITHNPQDIIIRFNKDVNWINHRDHRHTGQSTIDASYPYSRDLLFFPEHFQDSQAVSHSVTEFLLVDYYDHPDLVHIDITNHVQTRVKAHAQHSSQYPLQKAQESADFFTLLPSYPPGKRFERFRYLLAD